MTTPEGKIKDKVRKVMTECGFYHYAVNQSGLGRRGIPDDCLVILGQHYQIEFKAHMERNKHTKSATKTLPTALQCNEMDKCRRAGGITCVIDDANMDAFIAWLRNARDYIANGSSHVPSVPKECVWDIDVVNYIKYIDKINNA